ncbi:hypothetical protein [Flammeovirga agarivorans]|uniref:Uncharacterized protein n=1 Tax=Flammeovirga agarivorans TaxID=2726742 RepID=A0A7X8XZD2_9BACT|nr:hypothetical protein [Flammeovirga agarivorans]NLR95057.1 hypothetical protein [Flammeovirga agarivorans]
MSYNNENVDLSFELAGFTYFEGTKDLFWLADEEAETCMRDTVLKGSSFISKIFEGSYEIEDSPIISESRDISSMLINLRFQEMFQRAYEIAKSKGYRWTNINVLSTQHDFDCLYNTLSEI